MRKIHSLFLFFILIAALLVGCSGANENDKNTNEADIVNRSGPRIVEGVEELARAIYPETFK